jgi:hypothetical protein
LEISDFGFEVQDLSDFKISYRLHAGFVKYVVALQSRGGRVI